MDELEKLKKAKGSSSMLRFIHDAIIEKCEECSKNEREGEEERDPPGTDRLSQERDQTDREDDPTNDID